jgi:hypothetical protein
MRKFIAVLMMVIWTVGILYVLLGPHLASIETRMENLRQEHSQWPTVQGNVLEIRFHEADLSDDNDRSYAIVRFQYCVSGLTYTGKQRLYYYTDAQRNAIKYRIGQTVTVYHDPDQAAEAVIEPQRVDLYDVSVWWETMLRMLTYPSIMIGCIVIWCAVATGKVARNSSGVEIRVTCKRGGQCKE